MILENTTLFSVLKEMSFEGFSGVLCWSRDVVPPLKGLTAAELAGVARDVFVPLDGELDIPNPRNNEGSCRINSETLQNGEDCTYSLNTIGMLFGLFTELARFPILK